MAIPDYQTIISWTNDNQGPVAILIFIGTTILIVIGFFIKRFLFGNRSDKTLIQKQKGGDNSKNIQAGRDINIPK